MTRHEAGFSAREKAWPQDIAFLADQGLEPAEIDRIARVSRAQAMPAAQVAISDGALSEDAYYSKLAAYLGMPLLDNDALLPALSREHLRIPETTGSGIAVLVAKTAEGRSFAMAPAGGMIGTLMAATPAMRQRIALTTPSALQTCIRTLCSTQIAHQAAHALSEKDAMLCACGKPTLWQLLASVLLMVLLFFFGILEPLATAVVAGLVLGPMFLVLATVRMAAVFEPDATFAGQKMVLPTDAQLPIYTVLVPLLREVAILPQLVGALAALDYPASKLDIKFLVEANDHDLQAALNTMQLPPFISVLTVPPGEPRTKPRALNAGLLEARGTLLTIYDAEDVPDPQQLRCAAGILMRAPAHLACIQARLVIDNARDSLIARAFALEYAGLFDVINPGLVRSGLPFLLGGTSNHFRTDILRQVGGWDAWNVTEDADLAIRLVREGYTIGDCPSTTWEEAPANLGSWMRQRRRWMKGFMQSAATHSRQPLRAAREMGVLPCTTLISLGPGTVLSAMLYPLFWIMTFLAIRQGDVLAPQGMGQIAASSLALTLFAAGLLAMFGPPVLGAVRRKAWGLLWAVPFIPVYALLISIAAWWALLDWMVSPYHWHKTEHGFARHSQRKGMTTRSEP
jgi:glycosyltransferase XagB